MTLVSSIESWFEIAVPEPTKKNLDVQLGCHFEEVEEMLDSFTTVDSAINRNNAISGIRKLANDLKCGEIETSKIDKVALLDSLCDQIVTAIGVAYMLDMDIEGALIEVNDSNFSKFENGRPIFKENGKIGKGKDYFVPNLRKFIE